MHLHALLVLACAPGSIALADRRDDRVEPADADTDADADADADADTDVAGDPTSCADALARAPGAASGTYTIDIDGAGGDPPFDVYCDMTTDGGGWTRWWWFDRDDSVDWRRMSDVLGDELADCDPAAASCFARLPDAAATELRVTNGTDWATWAFSDGNRTSARARGAFLDRETSPYALDAYLDAWNPVRQSNNALRGDFACDADDEIASDGDCRNFWYTDMSVSGVTIRSFNLDDDGGYGQTAFAGGTDNAGADVGCDMLETSLTTTSRSCSGALFYR